MLECSPERMEKHTVTEAPNIYFHSDYWFFNEFKQFEDNRVLLEDSSTKITILELHPLEWKDPIRYDYSIDYEYTGHKTKEPMEKVHFLKLKIESNVLKTREVCVFYFHLENFRFLEEVILKNSLKIHTLVKTNSGMGFGGGKICISTIYEYLANLEVRYLYSDHMFHWNENAQERAMRAFPERPRDFILTKLYELGWNGGTGIYQIEPAFGDLTLRRFEETLGTITKCDRYWSEYVKAFPLNLYLE